MLRRFFVRLLGFAVEILLLCILFVLPLISPIAFAALTGALALVAGLRLELSRVPFDASYFHHKPTRAGVVVLSAATVFEVIVRAVFTSVATLFVFLGTDRARIALSTIAFGICAALGAWTLRGLAAALHNLHPARWAYFRMAILLGVVFSVIVSFAEKTPLKNLGWMLSQGYVKGLSMQELAEVLHGGKAQADRAIAFLFQKVLGPEIGSVAGVIVSIETLQGLAIAIYAIVIVEVGNFFVRWEWRGHIPTAE
jgi:hypothetical protein